MFCIFLHFFHSAQVRGSAISSSNSRERHFFYFTLAQAASFPIKYTTESMVYCSHLPGDWSQSQKLRNGQIFLMNNNKICWTRYRIEKCITTCSEKTFDTSLDQSWLIFWLDEKVAMNAATGQPEQTEAIKPPNQNSKQRYAAATKRGKTCEKEFQLVQPNTWYENFKPIAEWSNSFLLYQLWQLCCLTLAQCGLPPTDIISSS